MIDLDGRPVRVQAIGLHDRRPGAPVIVFEAGASNRKSLNSNFRRRFSAS
jgi:hypothetical protein